MTALGKGAAIKPHLDAVFHMNGAFFNGDALKLR